MRLPLTWKKLLLSSALLAVTIVVSCGGAVRSSTESTAAGCDCTPEEPASSDYRHAAKHVPLPDMTPTETDVSTILGWSVDASPAFDAPRTARETQVFHIAQAFLQSARIVPGDCDFHMEISQTADRTAPRMIVETPVDASFCAARQSTQTALAQRGFALTTTSGDLPQPLAISVVGLAFQDFEHDRGSKFVATPWELHPAIVTIQ